MTDIKSPIVFLSVFKSGTHLMRRIIEDLTGLPFWEPKIIPGKVNYQDPDQLFPVIDHFYSWHLFPIPAVRKKIRNMGASPILLLRNIYDVAVSMYYHFANNIDADIGRGRDVDHYFREFDKNQGIELIIKGLQRKDFNWMGLGPHLYQMELMFTLAQEYPCFITSFERLTDNKSLEVKKIADFLNITLNEKKITKITNESSFKVMKSKAVKKGVGSHYRNGKKNSHIKDLNSNHIQLIQEALQQHAPKLKRYASSYGIEEILYTPSTGRT